MVKTRSQMLTEGKVYTGIGFQRGVSPTGVFNEIHRAGGGIGKYYSTWDSFLARTTAYTTARVWGFLLVYDKLNPDPRRTARPDYMIMAGVLGGAFAGLITNPIDLVFTRMQVDELYPEQCRRNYRGIMDGLMKATDEGVLMRGSLANMARMAAICSSMTNVYDWCKENSYFFFGPSWINRLWATAVACGVGTAVSMPFDAVRTRLHAMRPLPNGVLPYTSSLDCLHKMYRFEGNMKFHSNLGCYFSGGQAYFARLFAICYVSQFLLDWYTGKQMVSEFWQPARFNYQGGLDYDIHEPFSDGFNKFMMSKWGIVESEAAYSPDVKTQLKVV